MQAYIKKKQSNTSICATNLTNAQILYDQHCEAKKTNQKICIHFDTMYSPAFPPTPPAYTIHLHTSLGILFTQTDSSDTFYSFVLSFGAL